MMFFPLDNLFKSKHKILNFRLYVVILVKTYQNNRISLVILL